MDSNLKHSIQIKMLQWGRQFLKCLQKHGMDYAPFTSCKMQSNIYMKRIMKRRTKRIERRRVKRRKKRRKRKKKKEEKKGGEWGNKRSIRF
jgi:hypothetical protein